MGHTRARYDNVCRPGMTDQLPNWQPYSSGVQQPRRATAIFSSRPHTHQAAMFGREQERAVSLHPEGQCSVDQTWTEREVCS